MWLMMEIHFIPAVHFIFPVVFLPLHQPALFMTELSTALHQYLLDLSMLPKEKKLDRERDTTGLLEFTFQGGCIIEIDS